MVGRSRLKWCALWGLVVQLLTEETWSGAWAQFGNGRRLFVVGYWVEGRVVNARRLSRWKIGEGLAVLTGVELQLQVREKGADS